MLAKDGARLAEIGGRVSGLVYALRKQMESEELAGEEDTTSRLLGLLANVLTIQRPDLLVKAKAITMHKVREEPHLGADALIALSYQSPQISLCKGVLVQAKLGLKRNMRTQEMNDLKAQCARMLHETRESYVWTYSPDAFRSYRAHVVQALTTNRSGDLCDLSLHVFFNLFLRCQIGDPELSLRDFDRLKRIIEAQNVRDILLVSVVSGDTDLSAQQDVREIGDRIDLDALAEQLEVDRRPGAAQDELARDEAKAPFLENDGEAEAGNSGSM